MNIWTFNLANDNACRTIISENNFLKSNKGKSLTISLRITVNRWIRSSNQKLRWSSVSRTQSNLIGISNTSTYRIARRNSKTEGDHEATDSAPVCARIGGRLDETTTAKVIGCSSLQTSREIPAQNNTRILPRTRIIRQRKLCRSEKGHYVNRDVLSVGTAGLSRHSISDN